jgi:hypothetical protein
VSQAVIDCLTERDRDKNIVPRSPESVSCRELEHKLQNVLVISTVELLACVNAPAFAALAKYLLKALGIPIRHLLFAIEFSAFVFRRLRVVPDSRPVFPRNSTNGNGSQKGSQRGSQKGDQ